MRKLFRLLAGIMITMIFAAPAFCLSFSIDPGAQSIRPGDMAMLELNISGLGDGAAPSLGAFDLTIDFDTNFLEFHLPSLVFSDFLGAPDTDLRPGFTTTFESDTFAALSAPGQINLGEVSLLPVAELQALQPSAFTLASFSFIGLNPGDTSIFLDPVVLSDENGLVLAELNLSAEVNLVPEPATILLLAIGFGGIALFRKKILKHNWRDKKEVI